MRAVRIAFTYTISVRGIDGEKMQDSFAEVALLVEDGDKKVVAIDCPSGIKFFEIRGTDEDGRFIYEPNNYDAALPHKDYWEIDSSGAADIPDEILRTMLDAVSMQRRLREAKRLALRIVNPRRFPSWTNA